MVTLYEFEYIISCHHMYTLYYVMKSMVSLLLHEAKPSVNNMDTIQVNGL